MGSDLSIVLRPCVPAPDFTRAVESNTPSPTDVRTASLLAYTELRLIDAAAVCDGDPNQHLIALQCALQDIKALDFNSAEVEESLMHALRCSECGGRVGLAIDSSVCIGRRLYRAEQRRMFTQALSLFLSKLSLWVAKNVPNGKDKTDATLGGDAHGDCHFFLLDLQHCLLDDVSGPWIVRDIVDNMGHARHYHSAVSMIYEGSRECPNTVLPIPTSHSAHERLSLTLSSLPFLTSENGPSRAFVPPNGTLYDFCSSLRYMRLSNNNMSHIGMRKCVLELTSSQGRRGPCPARHLQVIDVQQNDETPTTQHYFTELMKVSSARIVIGKSGVRWRHHQGMRCSISPANLRAYSEMSSYTPPPRTPFPCEDSGHANRTSTEDESHTGTRDLHALERSKPTIANGCSQSPEPAALLRSSIENLTSALELKGVAPYAHQRQSERIRVNSYHLKGDCESCPQRSSAASQLWERVVGLSPGSFSEVREESVGSSDFSESVRSITCKAAKPSRGKIADALSPRDAFLANEVSEKKLPRSQVSRGKYDLSTTPVAANSVARGKAPAGPLHKM
ncbi:hypothetical protein ERJ75_001749800 [Trypanosoma vivax]|nr:hypothetical protein ERJ75_001749800 [Trypanosoma vivax]